MLSSTYLDVSMRNPSESVWLNDVDKCPVELDIVDSDRVTRLEACLAKLLAHKVDQSSASQRRADPISVCCLIDQTDRSGITRLFCKFETCVQLETRALNDGMLTTHENTSFRIHQASLERLRLDELSDY